MIVGMNTKEFLARTAIITITGLSIVTIEAFSFHSIITTTTQVLGQEAKISNNNNTIITYDAGSALYNLTVGDRAFPIKFNISGGTLDTISIDGDQAILLVNISATSSGGKLTIELTRNLIDSKTQSDTDKPYLVYEDDIDRAMSFVESKTTGQTRTLVISFNNEDNLIEIQGNKVLSESGGEF
jgi:hypothetical protein